MKARFNILSLTVVLVGLFASAAAFAQGTTELRNFISVSSTGKVKVRPDLAVIVLEVRSTAPLAADAVQQNDKRVADVLAKVKELGVGGEGMQFTGNQFTSVGGGRIYMPGGQRPTGFEVFNILQIPLRGIDFSKSEELDKKLATVLDELGKFGAGIVSPDISRYSLGGSSAVIFTIQRPEAFEKQAYEMAIEKARPIAEEIAKKMGVKITGVHSVQSYGQRVVERPYGTYELDYPYTASSPDDLAVKVNVVVNFAFTAPRQ